MSKTQDTQKTPVQNASTPGAEEAAGWWSRLSMVLQLTQDILGTIFGMMFSFFDC
jgi:ATP-binding cassette subfamily C (CFTR/MRP) protein 1